jgi:hypothetical protein
METDYVLSLISTLFLLLSILGQGRSDASFFYQKETYKLKIWNSFKKRQDVTQSQKPAWTLLLFMILTLTISVSSTARIRSSQNINETRALSISSLVFCVIFFVFQIAMWTFRADAKRVNNRREWFDKILSPNTRLGAILFTFVAMSFAIGTIVVQSAKYDAVHDAIDGVKVDGIAQEKLAKGKKALEKHQKDIQFPTELDPAFPTALAWQSPYASLTRDPAHQAVKEISRYLIGTPFKERTMEEVQSEYTEAQKQLSQLKSSNQVTSEKEKLVQTLKTELDKMLQYQTIDFKDTETQIPPDQWVRGSGGFVSWKGRPAQNCSMTKTHSVVEPFSYFSEIRITHQPMHQKLEPLISCSVAVNLPREMLNLLTELAFEPALAKATGINIEAKYIRPGQVLLDDQEKNKNTWNDFSSEDAKTSIGTLTVACTAPQADAIQSLENCARALYRILLFAEHLTFVQVKNSSQSYLKNYFDPNTETELKFKVALDMVREYVQKKDPGFKDFKNIVETLWQRNGYNNWTEIPAVPCSL